MPVTRSNFYLTQDEQMNSHKITAWCQPGFQIIRPAPVYICLHCSFSSACDLHVQIESIWSIYKFIWNVKGSSSKLGFFLGWLFDTTTLRWHHGRLVHLSSPSLSQLFPSRDCSSESREAHNYMSYIKEYHFLGLNTVKPVCKGHLNFPENVTHMTGVPSSQIP